MSASPPEVAIGFYGSRPIERARRRNVRTKAEMDEIRAAIYQVVAREHPMTVRQVFYRMVSTGLIAKTESEYKKTVGRLLTHMRRAEALPYSWIVDNTRWMRKPRTFSGLRAALERTVQTYRRALWDEQEKYVEVWLEKDALAGVVYDVTGQWDVPLMVTRGYPSLGYLHGAAETIIDQDKPAFLYYFGDHDPSGVDISRVVERELRQFTDGAEIYFERVAVTSAQIQQWNLPTRPTKKTDSRSQKFAGESVEVDAIPPSQLRQLVEDCILHNVDREELHRLEAIEDAERATLQGFLQRWEEREGHEDDAH